MRIAVFLSASCAALALVSGCSVVPGAAWTFDPAQPLPKLVAPPEQVAVLTDRVAQLQLERNGVRARIAEERDIWARQRLYRQLHGIGMELSPAERELAMMAAAR
jgi:hypothetical protein